MDCLEGMKELDDRSIDMIVTDPPYLMNYKSNRRVTRQKFDHILNDQNQSALISSYIKECHRILKNNTAIYMFCSWHNIDFFKSEFQKYFKMKNLIVWNKNNHGSGDLKGAYAPKHELILYGHKGRTVFQCGRMADVIDFAKIPSADLVHPTEKPIGLLEYFIRNNSNESDVVFDGFIGCGSTALACMNLSRKFLGFELDSNYYRIANDRISKHVPKGA